MRFYYPGFKIKALTFSYDDGCTQDIRLIELFNRHGVKGTFNLNSGRFGNVADIVRLEKYKVPFSKIESEKVADTYRGHEVATHSYTHPNLCKISDEEIEREINLDIDTIEKLVGYRPLGHAYPGGDYTDHVIGKLRELGIKYARTIESTKDFSLPENFLAWHPTCYDHEEGVSTLASKFIAIDKTDGTLPLFYIWGHSFEFDIWDTDRWADMDVLCAALSGDRSTWYATNLEICNYVTAIRSVKESGTTVNNTGLDLYIEKNGVKVTWKAGSELR